MLAARAKVAPGRGSLKQIPPTCSQPTLLGVLSLQQELGEELGNEESDTVAWEREGDLVGCLVEREEGVVVGQESEDGVVVGEDAREGEGEEGVVVRREPGEEVLIEECDLGEDSGEELQEQGEHDCQPKGRAEYSVATDHPFLVDLSQYLKSCHGKGRSEREAKQIVAEVGRYLITTNRSCKPLQCSQFGQIPQKSRER